MSSSAEGLMETLRATAAGFGGYDELEACAVEREETRLRLRGEKVRESSVVGRVIVSVSMRRGLKRVRVVGSSANSGDIRDLLLRAHAVLRESEDLPAVLDRRYAKIGTERSPSFDETYGTIPHEEKIGRLTNFVTHVKKNRPDAFVSAADFIERRDRRWIWATALPKTLVTGRTLFGLKASVRAPADSDFLRLGDFVEESHYYDTDWSGFGRQLGALLARLKNASNSVTGGNQAALLSPVVGTQLLGELQALFRGDTSPIKSGARVGSAHVNISDDPNIQKRVGSRLFDDEGTPTEKLALTREGFFLNPIYTVETGAWSGVASSGHGLLDFGTGRIDSRVHNLQLEPGAKDPVDLARDIGTGLQILSWTPLSKPEWSKPCLARVSGNRLERGEPKEAFRDVLVEWTPKDLLNDIDAVGRDLTWRGRVGCPSVVLRKLKVL